jgi:formylglycine-generating enzyme required for sulfatase activity
VFIQPGTFIMGSPTNEALRAQNETQHEVTLSRGFWIGKYLVTQADYLSVTSTNPSYFSLAYNYPEDLTRPVEQVSWYDATNYCGLRTVQELAAGLIPTNCVYRLPTEAEWEYSARAGTTTALFTGTGLHSGQANFVGFQEYDSEQGEIYNPNGVWPYVTTPVGSYQPNDWGLYDMAGNVFEYCQDWLGPYPDGPVVDPHNSYPGYELRVIRGGDWDGSGDYCRSAFRLGAGPAGADNGLGFRVVLAPEQPGE